uniref:AIG1-type G domain-containing protein n=1 Tax=Chlamydomonas euryale TaxID=1486919 RepID=A0A7R9V4P2_9CHLO
MERMERIAGAKIYKGARRVDLARAAERTARELDASQGPSVDLGVKVKVLLIGVAGVGKSEFINAMLGRRACRTSATSDATRRVRVVKGSVNGVSLSFIDTPGLHASNTRQLANKQLLKQIKAAYNRHKPNFVFYVDRLDATRPSLGELNLLGLMNEVLGPKVWRELMIILTHAHSARSMLGPQYDLYSRQRRNIMMQVVRQAAGDMQVRNPMHLVESHPDCPTNSFGQPIILDGENQVPWKQALYMQLVGYRLYEQAQALFRDKVAGKDAAKAVQAKQMDMFKQLMRPRLPPVSFFVEQMAEGVLKPEVWGAMDDPLDVETDDEEAEEYQHVYHRLMHRLAVEGNPVAQKEYDAMLRGLQRLQRTYKDAFENEDLEMMAGAGYEGYVTEGLDLGLAVDPEDGTNHRYCYAVAETDWQIMPTLDYYGFEHEDAITGFVADYEAQFLNRDGWGGVPFDLHLAVEKDKSSTCLQGESRASLVHSVPPFGPQHVTTLTSSFELLRPNLKDVLYQWELNTFRDSLIAKHDHAGAGLMLARLGTGGSLKQGPTGVGVRLQETARVGPFKVSAVGARVASDGASGGKDEAWGGRAHVLCDWVPGVGMLFDFYQQKTKEGEPQIGGGAANFTYDFEVAGCAAGVEVDYVIGGDAMHIDMNVFSANDWRLAWLLVLPGWNWLRGTWRRIREGGVAGGAEEVVEEELMEEEEGDDDDGMMMM